jgi:hypothetical protein
MLAVAPGLCEWPHSLSARVFDGNREKLPIIWTGEKTDYMTAGALYRLSGLYRTKSLLEALHAF